MDAKTWKIVNDLLSAMENMDYEERQDVFSALSEKYCPECGGTQTILRPCQCMNDE